MPPESSSRLLELVRRPLARSIFTVMAGNLVGNGFNLIALFLLGVALGPELLGIFTALTMAMMLIAQLSDFGLNTTLIKFYRQLYDAERTQEAEALMRRAFFYRLLLVVVLGGVCMAFAGPISRQWLGEPAAVDLFYLACLGAVGSSLWMFMQAAMQSRQQFRWYAILTVCNHLLRLALVGLLFFQQALNVPAAIWIWVGVPFVGSLGASLLNPREFWSARIGPAQARERMIEVFHFSKWIFLSTVICTFIMRTDVFLLTLLSSKWEVGQFGMANNLAMGFPMITAAISTVLLPKIAGTRRRSEMLRIKGYFVRAIPLLLMTGAVVIGLAQWLLPIVREGAFAASAPVFHLLVLSFMISVLVNPLSFFCLSFDRAWWLTAMNLVQLAINAGLDWWLIPRYGALAAGISTLAIRLFALGFLVIAFGRLLGLAEPDNEKRE